MQILYDISLSRKHIGTPHGLVRVEVSIARELLEIDSELKPIWIDNNHKVTVGKFDDFRILTDGSSSKNAAFSNFELKAIVPKETSNYLGDLKRIPLKNRLIVVATYVISLFPDAFSKPLWNISKRLYFFLSKIVKPFRRLFSTTAKSVGALGGSNSQSLTSSKSLVLIPGNDWDRRILEFLPTDESSPPKVATIIYDLIPYDFPHYSVDIETSGRYTYWIGDIAQRSDYLFFISRFSQERFNVMLKERRIESKGKQMVISLPPGIMPSPELSVPDFSNELESSFILVVCTIEARKNHQILVSAIRLAISRNEKLPQLVFIGSPGWGTKQLMHEIDKDEDLRDRIVVKSGVSDAELRWLYEKCTAVAYPSIVEGFGLPVFEAAVFKKPIISSDIPVFDEIPHPLRTKVNPYDTEGWKNALQNAGSEIEPPGGWQELQLPTWKENVQQMIAFMSE